MRGRDISVVFQWFTSLNPGLRIGLQVAEPLIEHLRLSREQAMKRAVAALKQDDTASTPERLVNVYPHQMSGGMKQRVVGAIAISGEPEVLIADEPTTALDVTIQLQYLKLLKRLQAETGMAILFITHDFGVVGRMCDRVAVMYAGRIVECGPVKQIFEAPAHPYTRALIASVPRLTARDRQQRLAPISSVDLTALPGCVCAPRCPYGNEMPQAGLAARRRPAIRRAAGRPTSCIRSWLAGAAERPMPPRRARSQSRATSPHAT